MVTMITPVAIESIGYRYYIVYTCIGFCIPFLIYFLYPEVCLLTAFVYLRSLTISCADNCSLQTMGRSLEDIDLIFRQSPFVLGTVKFAKKMERRPIERIVVQAEKKGESEHEEVV